MYVITLYVIALMTLKTLITLITLRDIHSYDNLQVGNRREAMARTETKLALKGLLSDAKLAKLRKTENNLKVEGYRNYCSYLGSLRASQKNKVFFEGFPTLASVEQKLAAEGRQRVDAVTQYEQQLVKTRVAGQQKVQQIALFRDQLNKQFNDSDRELMKRLMVCMCLLLYIHNFTRAIRALKGHLMI